jgi:hypothetical protein
MKETSKHISSLGVASHSKSVVSKNPESVDRPTTPLQRNIQKVRGELNIPPVTQQAERSHREQGQVPAQSERSSQIVEQQLTRLEKELK